MKPSNRKNHQRILLTTIFALLSGAALIFVPRIIENNFRQAAIQQANTVIHALDAYFQSYRHFPAQLSGLAPYKIDRIPQPDHYSFCYVVAQDQVSFALALIPSGGGEASDYYSSQTGEWDTAAGELEVSCSFEFGPTHTFTITGSPTPSLTPTVTATWEPRIEYRTPYFIQPTLLYAMTYEPEIYQSITADALTATHTPEPYRPTSTAQHIRSTPLALPGDLYIEEVRLDEGQYYYRYGSVYGRSTYRGGEYLNHHGGYLHGMFFDVQSIRYGPSEYHVGAFLNGTKLYDQKCDPDPNPMFINAFTFGDHWAVQVNCVGGRFDVILDGISLNATRGYDESYAFQVLNSRPFYLFTRDDQVWLWYDDQEVPLGYDYIDLSYCCMLEYGVPIQSEYRISFYAFKDKTAYYVSIGYQYSDQYWWSPYK